MTLSNPGLRQTFAASAIALLALAAVQTAYATSSYDAYAEYTLILDSVTDLSGASVERGWSVNAEGFLFNSSAVSTGTADADYLTGLAPALDLGIGDSVSQSSRSFGDAEGGTASSTALTDLQISVENLLDQSLVFTFDYQAAVETLVTGPVGDFAEGRASVEVFDELDVFDTLINVFVNLPLAPLSDSDADSGSFSFTLLSGESNVILAMIDSTGNALAETPVEPAPNPTAGTVPEPGSIVLMVLGLIFLALLYQQNDRSV